MSRKLKSLLKTLPLSERWQVPELFHEEVRIENRPLHLLGLSSERAEGGAAFGSAAGEDRDGPVERAYFELLERACILDAYDGALRFQCLTPDGQEVGQRTREDVFPESPSPGSWVYSRSNGVAAHKDWKNACRSASLELLERDHVLRAWYGQTRPVALAWPSPRNDLPQSYAWEAYRFPAPPGQPSTAAAVVGVFAFPLKEELPLVYGFGAKLREIHALAHALRECRQRMGFLWEQEGADEDHASPEVLNFSPTPDFHQETFLRASAETVLRNWLRGGHLGMIKLPEEAPSESPLEFHFADLTPAHLRGRLCVAKALCPRMMPLTFGRLPILRGVTVPEALLIHPIA